MTEPTNSSVVRSTFRHERKMTEMVMHEIRVAFHTKGRNWTRRDLLKYLRRESTIIEADLIQEGK